MKKIVCLLLAVLMVTSLAFALSSPSLAEKSETEEDSPSLEELVRIAQIAVKFDWYCYEGNYFYRSDNHKYGLSRCEDEFYRWLISKGMLLGTLETLETKKGSELLPFTDLHTGEISDLYNDLYSDTPYYAFPPEITMKEIKEAYFSLFYYDVLNVFECTIDHPIYGEPGGRMCIKNYFREDSDGRVYMRAGMTGLQDAEEYTSDAVWDSMRITYKDSKKIIIESSPEISTGFSKNRIVEFRKNKDGWRVYSSNLLLSNCPPPKTGDNTPVFVAFIALPALGLGMLAVKKGKEEEKKF